MGYSHLEGKLLAGAQVVYPVCNDVVDADSYITEGQQVLLTQLCALLQQIVIVLEVQHGLQVQQLQSNNNMSLPPLSFVLT